MSVAFDPVSGIVRRGESVARLEPQPAALLALLAERPGELVTHEDIRQRLWGDGTHVRFHEGVHYCVRQIRKALGDDARQPRFVETVPRRGYRLLVPLAPTSSVFPSFSVARQPWVRRAAVAAAAVTVGALLFASFDRRPNDHHQTAARLLAAAHDLIF